MPQQLVTVRIVLVWLRVFYRILAEVIMGIYLMWAHRMNLGIRMV